MVGKAKGGGLGGETGWGEKSGEGAGGGANEVGWSSGRRVEVSPRSCEPLSHPPPALGAPPRLGALREPVSGTFSGRRAPLCAVHPFSFLVVRGKRFRSARSCSLCASAPRRPRRRARSWALARRARPPDALRCARRPPCAPPSSSTRAPARCAHASLSDPGISGRAWRGARRNAGRSNGPADREIVPGGSEEEQGERRSGGNLAKGAAVRETRTM